MQHLQPSTTLHLFLDVRAEAGYSIERVLGQGGFGN